MRKSSVHNRRPPRAPGFATLLATLALPLAIPRADAQNAPPVAPAAMPGATQPPSNGVITPGTNVQPTQSAPPTAPTPSSQLPSAASQAPQSGPPSDSTVDLKLGPDGKFGPNGEIAATQGVEIGFAGATVTADRVTGNINHEVVFSGHAHIEAHGVRAFADAIHVFPNNTFILDNPRGSVDPDLMENQIYDEVFLTGGTLTGALNGYADAERTTATTCIELHHHYELRARSAELIPHKQLTLRNVSFILFDVKIITLPFLVIPLDQRTIHRPRSDYLPEFGQNTLEGYYARFPYEFPEKNFAATFLRLNVTQLKGEGYRVEQEYLLGKQPKFFDTSGYGADQGGFTGAATGVIANAYGYGNLGPGLPRLGTGLGPQNGGLFAMQGYFSDGFNNNFNASFRQQQDIGGSNRYGFTSELQRNSFFTFSGQTSLNNRLDFTHADTAHGVNGALSITYNTNNSSDSSGGSAATKQLSADYRQSFDFGQGSTRNSLSYSLDLTRSTSVSDSPAGEIGMLTARLDSQFQFQHMARDYSYNINANKSFDLHPTAGIPDTGGVEHLPELQFSTETINYKDGFLSRAPLRFDLGVGRYAEPGHLNGDTLLDDRFTLAATLQDVPILKGRTEATFGGGFEQRFYSDGAAQYILHDTARLRQHLGGRSGFDLTYDYQQPEGGTPFFFDTFSRTHNITAEGGYLDDQHFQFTIRTGYDLLGTSNLAPWQSIAMRMMYRPNPRIRYDALATYDLNTSQWFAFSNSLKIRARNDFGIDLLGRYDPTNHLWSQVNTQFDVPVGRTWRLTGLLRYNGVTKNFDSRNLQITHDWDCMEASLSYTETALGYFTDREFFFTLRIKAFPFFHSFARGPAGETLSTGVGDLY